MQNPGINYRGFLLLRCARLLTFSEKFISIIELNLPIYLYF